MSAVIGCGLVASGVTEADGQRGDTITMKRFLPLLLLVAALLATGCRAQTGDYLAAAAISRNGFAVNDEAIRALEGKEVKLWGYVDHGNLYGDAGAKAILGEWWSGEGPDATTWRFNLKANAGDATGQSFPVHVRNDAGRDDLLARLLADARAQQPTQVFVTGRLFTFDAPANIAARTGIYLEVASSADLLFEPPGAESGWADGTGTVQRRHGVADQPLRFNRRGSPSSSFA